MARTVTNFSNLKKNDEQEKYRAYIKSLYIILGIGTVFFYILPFITGVSFGNDTKFWSGVIVPMMLVNINPIYAFISCILHTRKFGVNLVIPAMIAVFFVPSAMIFYGPSIALVGLIYLVLGVFGELAGFLIIKRRESKRAPIGVNTLNRHMKQKQQKGKKRK